tara:strand:+ start:875 stop:1840 length:966 start_codon:yes stop_codon:yes gene_type:complete
MDFTTELIPEQRDGWGKMLAGKKARIARASSAEDLISFIKETPVHKDIRLREDYNNHPASEKPYTHTSKGDSIDWDIVEASDCGAAKTGGFEMVEFYIDLAESGFSRAREGLRETMIEVAAGANNAPRPDFIYDVAGAIPSVPTYLSGDPASMMDLTPVPTKPSCRVSVEVSTPWFVSDKAIYNRGCAILSVIEGIERQGIHVELSAIISSVDKDRLFAVTLPVREMGEAYDLDKLAYFLCCPGPLRRLGFAIVERDEILQKYTHKGYGEGKSKGMTLGEYDLVFPRLDGERKNCKWEDYEYAFKTVKEIAEVGGFAPDTN